MIPRQLFRSLYTNYVLYEAPKKSLLSKLRKKTGYTFINCKKALEVNDNDMAKAEQWLKDQAQKEGWSQATKLQSRVTTQGLIAMITKKNHGALVEINCETDFVARNKKFHDLAEIIVSTVLKHGTTIEQNSLINKTLLDTELIIKLSADDGVYLYGCTHPSPINPVPSSFGRYGALVAIKSNENKEVLGMQLCQHIIGMNPVKIGDPKIDEPFDNIEDEPVMLYQEFLLDPSLSIQQLLQSEQIEVLDFARFEIGETMESKQMLDTVETCG
ncbi:Elongation factor Ts, mitochondrial [Anthophora retusa]